MNDQRQYPGLAVISQRWGQIRLRFQAMEIPARRVEETTLTRVRAPLVVDTVGMPAETLRRTLLQVQERNVLTMAIVQPMDREAAWVASLCSVVTVLLADTLGTETWRSVFRLSHGIHRRDEGQRVFCMGITPPMTVPFPDALLLLHACLEERTWRGVCHRTGIARATLTRRIALMRDQCGWSGKRLQTPEAFAQLLYETCTAVPSATVNAIH